MTNPQAQPSDTNPFNNSDSGHESTAQQDSVGGWDTGNLPVPADQQSQQGWQDQPSQQGWQDQPSQQGWQSQQNQQGWQPQQGGAHPQQMAYAPGQKPKSKLTALLLCFFLGGFGVHNFYLGHTGRGIGQIVLGVFSGLLAIFGVGLITGLCLSLWVIVELILIAVNSGSYATELD